MKKIAVVAILYLLFCAGCQGILEHSERELRDHTKSQQVFKNTLPVRTDQIGVAVGYFGADKITQGDNELIEEYLKAAAEDDPNTMIYYKRAETFGKGLRLYENMLKQCWLELQGYWR